MSLSSVKLRSLSHKLLSPAECQQLKIIIQSFKENRSIFGFCSSLKVILNTTEKMQILTLLHSMVPDDLLSDYDSLCCIHFDYYKNVLQPKIKENLLKKQKKSPQKVVDKKPFRHGSVLEPAKGTVHASVREKKDRRRTRSMEGSLDGAQLQRAAQRVPGRKDKKGEEVERKERKRSKTAHVVLLGMTSTSDLPPVTKSNQGSSGSDRAPQNVKVRKVKLENRPGESLGFCIRGGKDLNAGIFISSIDPGGQAESKGLKVGERILKVNDTSLKSVTHGEAVVAIKSAYKLTLYLAQIGQMPGTPHDTPRSQDGSQSQGKQEVVSVNRERTVLLVADDDGFLGCSIRGGVDYGLPVIVASVDPLSPAHRAGLKKGELIVQVNGQDISGLDHLDIVDMMTNSNVVKMLVMPRICMKQRTSSQSSDLRRSPRLQNVGNQKKGSTLLTRKSSCASQLPSTPLRIRKRVGDVTALEEELRATPPRSTSTPLPNEGHMNQNIQVNESLFSCERSTFQHSEHPIPTLTFQESDQGNDIISYVNTSGGSSMENISPHDEKMKEFEKGTIRLNMNSKEKLKGLKLVEINYHSDGSSKEGNRRQSVKNIFFSQDELCNRDTEENISSQDVLMDNLESEESANIRNCSPKPSNQDLRRPNDQQQQLNILSSPNVTQSQDLLKVSGKVSPLLLPLQNIDVSCCDQSPTTTNPSKLKKKSRLSLAARIFSKKRVHGSISSSTSAYSSSESLDSMVQGRQLPSVSVDDDSNNQDWLMY
ncbi:uncharacterized protein LOC117107853 [Anneissia japonica]|uniref:uncharacterized protein LOC117107853 n=1 Tax=Anneissia japonica TaxID=1529436 RepID=UPI0014259F03|nr:uncharacterized protein LOC117107853 [Anneissia japonica]XP_033105544.1 uncharacterized protein LOC117107853 [Anneissia japonica]XP_033105545.1 uncharacterized protein LOC117107853 [Anneissia japonica]